MPRYSLPLTAALIACAGAAIAQTPPPPRAPALTPEQEAERIAARNLPNIPGSGPYPAIMEVSPSLPNHVIYRPAAMPAAKLGVLVWGNGGCQEYGASARQHLLEIASHGYVVIAPGRIMSGPPPPKNCPTPYRAPPAVWIRPRKAPMCWRVSIGR